MKAMADWFRRYTEREQAYLLAAAAALILYTLYMGVWKPVAEMRADMAQRNAATEQTLARVQALGRRTPSQAVAPEEIRIDDLTIDLGRCRAWRGGEEMELTPREAGILRSEGKEYVVQDGDIILFRFNV